MMGEVVLSTPVLYGIFIGLQVLIFVMFKVFKNMQKKVQLDTIEQYVSQIMTQYDTSNYIMNMFDKEGKTKQLRYQVRETLKTIRKYLDTLKNEKMTEEEKIESVKLYISQKLKEYIEKYEEKHGDVVDDDTLIKLSEYIVNFLQPVLFKDEDK